MTMYQIVDRDGQPIYVGLNSGRYFRRENAEAYAVQLNESGVAEFRPYGVVEVEL